MKIAKFERSLKHLLLTNNHPQKGCRLCVQLVPVRYFARVIEFKKATYRKRVDGLLQTFQNFFKSLRRKIKPITDGFVKKFPSGFESRKEEAENFYNYVKQLNIVQILKEAALYDLFSFMFSHVWPTSTKGYYPQDYSVLRCKHDMEQFILKGTITVKPSYYLFVRSKDRVDPDVYSISLNTAKYIGHFNKNFTLEETTNAIKQSGLELPNKRIAERLAKLGIYAN